MADDVQLTLEEAPAYDDVEAWKRGCRRAHLETFSYQARAFYERRGYAPFARLPDYPPGHERVYLQKRLAPGGGRSANRSPD